MRTTKTFGMIAITAMAMGCYGGAEEAAQDIAEAQVGDRFRHPIPGVWTALTALKCAAQAGTAPRTVVVGGCTITYVDQFCRQAINESGVLSCVCEARITGMSGTGCGDVRL